MLQKEVNDSNRCSISNDGLGRRLSTLLLFFQEAERDFPFLTTEEVEIKTYRNKTVGIEFDLPEGTIIPESYSRVPYLDNTI